MAINNLSNHMRMLGAATLAQKRLNKVRGKSYYDPNKITIDSDHCQIVIQGLPPESMQTLVGLISYALSEIRSEMIKDIIDQVAT